MSVNPPPHPPFQHSSKCKYPFCYYCSQLWHGYASYCQVRNIVKVVDAYNEGSEFEKARLLKQYGEKAITRMIVEVTNERENLKWVSNNTQVCPTCSTAIEKSEGCNHMHCFTCQTHFCYRCGSYLDAKAPYMHYK